MSLAIDPAETQEFYTAISGHFLCNEDALRAAPLSPYERDAIDFYGFSEDFHAKFKDVLAHPVNSVLTRVPSFQTPGMVTHETNALEVTSLDFAVDRAPDLYVWQAVLARQRGGLEVYHLTASRDGLMVASKRIRANGQHVDRPGSQSDTQIATTVEVAADSEVIEESVDRLRDSLNSLPKAIRAFNRRSLRLGWVKEKRDKERERIKERAEKLTFSTGHFFSMEPVPVDPNVANKPWNAHLLGVAQD